MRIAFVVNNYPPHLGGLEQHVENLAQQLTESGHEVTVLTIGSPTGQRLDGKVRVITGHARFPVADVISFPSWGTRRKLTKFLRDERFDAVSVHTRFFPMSFIGVRAARAAGLPVVHTEHGSGFVASNSFIITQASRLFDLTLGRYVLKHADRVLGVSEEAAAFAKKLGGRETEVFYNAIPYLEPQTNVQDRPEHLVFVGRMVSGKGWDDFLKAISELRTMGHQVDGEMLGDGAALPAAEALARELGLADVVAIRGRVSAQQVRSSLSGATLVNPTVLSEGFQTTLLEAIAEKGRVVTYQVPGSILLRDTGMPVAITPKKTAMSLVETLDRYLSNPMPLVSPEAIQAWTWPHRALEYAEIIHTTAEQKKHS